MSITLESAHIATITDVLYPDILTILVSYLNIRQLLTLACNLQVGSCTIDTAQNTSRANLFKCMLIQLLSRLHVGHTVTREIFPCHSNTLENNFRRNHNLFFSAAHAIASRVAACDSEYSVVNIGSWSSHSGQSCLSPETHTTSMRKLVNPTQWMWRTWVFIKNRTMRSVTKHQQNKWHVLPVFQARCQVIMHAGFNHILFIPYIVNVNDEGEVKQYVIHKLNSLV
jgi:hypothetical protein